MKFLTVLRDSYREAVDGKIFQAMVVLSGLFILFVASISYRPLTLKDALENQFSLTNALVSRNPSLGQPTFSIDNYRVTNGAAEPWKGDYELDFVVTCPSKESLETAKKSNLPGTTLESTKSLMLQACYYLSNQAVTEVADTPPNEMRFRFTSRGTTVTEASAWPHEPKLLFGVRAPIFTATLRGLVYSVEQRIVNGLGGLAVLLIGVVVTAGFIPNLMRKGTLDLYIVKPISRSELLVYKYVGGLLTVFLLSAITITGVWITIGLRAGVWAPEFLLLIPIITLYFAILYAVSVLIGVLSRNALVAILAALMAWGALSLVGYLNDKIREVRQQEQKIRNVLGPNAQLQEGERSALGLPRGVETALHALAQGLPRGWDLDTQASRAIARGVLTEQEVQQRNLDEPLPSWAETIGVSVLWIAVFLGLACWRFETRDG
jgi:ABC-type transport system involved in multi-copper enzyme maturation permease subunit